MPGANRPPSGGINDRQQAGLESQRDRVFHGQLGTRPDGVVSGVRGVAEQHGPLAGPALAAHRAEARPPGAVADQGVARQLPSKRLLEVAQGGEVGRVGRRLPSADLPGADLPGERGDAIRFVASLWVVFSHVGAPRM